MRTSQPGGNVVQAKEDSKTTALRDEEVGSCEAGKGARG